MKSLRVSLRPPEAFVHPMHAFVADTPGFRRTSLLHWNPTVGERNTLIFYVDGDDPAAYADAIEATPSIIDAEVVPADGRRGFYLAVHEGQREADAALTDAFVGVGVVVVPPVSFLADRGVALSLVGTKAALDAALDHLPDSVTVEVVRVHDYDGRVTDPAAELTERQREALGAAVELGYYGDPRTASVADVADRIDCSPGTAAEHLRKAESTVFERLMRDAPASW